MTKPDDIPQDVWVAALNAASAAVREDDPGFYITKRAADVLMEASARAILAERRSRFILVALNAEGEVRAMANLEEPWAIEEFIATMKGWADVPERRVAIRKSSPSPNITNEHPVEPATTSIPHKGGVR
jgi:hypothetical protein